MKFLIHSIIIIFLPTSLLLAGNIHGFLRDADTGEPLMYANVVLLGTNVGTASDNSGHYVLTNIAPGNYTIKVMTMGFTSEKIGRASCRERV